MKYSISMMNFFDYVRYTKDLANSALGTEQLFKQYKLF